TVSPPEGLIAASVSWKGGVLAVAGRTVPAIDTIATLRWEWRDSQLTQIDAALTPCGAGSVYVCVRR
ncbi:MAG: hypothetical protein LC808_06485, partial [Actinobacteria bacterium]|nr:hypothetical protein [Actinomycetota bacterium]